jgi:uracil-DNA glycosylase
MVKNWKDLSFFASGDWEKVLDRAYAHKDVTPYYGYVFRALAETALPDVKVCILGQDPYPTKGVADGLAFSASETSYLAGTVPASLRNIHTEYVSDLGYSRPSGGSLLPWAKRGVLLLNTSLTCVVGKPASHADIGWSELIDEVIEEGIDRSWVFILWGKHAQDTYDRNIDIPSARALRSAHPSPLSASKGFFGSRPFTRANALLGTRRAVDWRLP